MLVDGRLPECWIPPAHILEARALLELYRDLRVEHTAWVQRIHAVLFHQGAPRLSGEGGLRTEPGRAELAAITAEHLDAVRRQLRHAAGHLTGAKILHARFDGSGRSPRWRCAPGWPGLLHAKGGPIHRPGRDRVLLAPDATIPTAHHSSGAVGRRGRRRSC
ncbi:MAG: hypothetical protein ABI384_08795 [Allobranchiibius sp.]